jgi:hypothetical protein
MELHAASCEVNDQVRQNPEGNNTPDPATRTARRTPSVLSMGKRRGSSAKSTSLYATPTSSRLREVCSYQSSWAERRT